MDKVQNKLIGRRVPQAKGINVYLDFAKTRLRSDLVQYE